MQESDDSYPDDAPDPARGRLGPIRPSDTVQAEMVALLEADKSQLGEVYRRVQQGMAADAIAAELGVASTGFVWRQKRIARALVEGNLPTAPTVALRAARRFRSILKSETVSDDARTYLQTNLDELERRANDEDARARETEFAKEQTQQAESRDEPGIYVYALPHYLRYPFEPGSGRTLLKVGRSDSDVIKRFNSQTRTTALPEEPVLLRIYRINETSTARAESDFHRLLESADHSRNVARSAGREWFVTSTRFLDEIARVMRLPIVVVNEAVDFADD
jgi:hypothetical protein